MTEKKAIEISIELWTFLAETGKKKWEWGGWKKYGDMNSDCALCEYNNILEDAFVVGCPHCPYYQRFGDCCKFKTPYECWEYAKTPRTRKKYAKLFLEQLKEL